MKAILFAPDSGNQYKEFQREAAKAAQRWGAEVHFFPASKPEAVRRAFVLDVLRKNKGAELDLVAFLCHGYRVGIQAGFNLATAGELAAAIAAACKVGASVPLYCCSTGKGPGVDKDGEGDGVGPGEGSFADDLRDGLVAHGMLGGYMFCHTTAGHLSRNPDARVYKIRAGEAGGLDVHPLAKGRDAYKRWRGYLHTPGGRWDLATMSHSDIEAAALKCAPYVEPK